MMAVTLLKCKVTPKAQKSEILGWLSDDQGVLRLRIKLAAPPVDGKANQELLKFLSKKLEVPRSRLKLVAGEKSRLKSVEIVGLEEDQLKCMLK